MMTHSNSPFRIIQSMIIGKDHSYVTWTPDVKKFVLSYILLDVLFAVLKCEEIGLGVKLNSGEVDLLWIDKKTWEHDRSLNYSHYVQEMYVIDGVVFKDNSKAVEFHDWLEKKYMWEALSV